MTMNSTGTSPLNSAGSPTATRTVTENLRDFVERLRAAGELVDLRQPVDVRHMATLVDQSDKALLFHNPIGFKIPVLSGILRSTRRAFLAMGCESYREIEEMLTAGLANPIPPTRVETSSTEEVILTGDEVNLFDLPVPLFSVHDGGPMITAGIVMARDPEYGLVNTGCYRFMVKEKNLTGIDIVTPNNLKHYAQRAFEAGRPLPISISIGTHPIEMIAANFRAPMEQEEMSIAGGIRGASVPLGQCRTIDLPYVADCEIVLEAEILPVGWTQPEGRFGEFTFLMGGLHWNPNVRVKAVMMRKDAMYWALHMPFEYTYLGAAVLHQPIRSALTNTGIKVKDINVTVGGSAYWHAVISIKKQAGEGKSALLAALSVGDLKHVVVVDEEIDVYNPMEVEWAIATRVQGDRDVIIIPGARAKPLDPSLPFTPGRGPATGAKVGIDATIGEGIPHERYERVAYAYSKDVDVADYVAGKADPLQKGDPAAVDAICAEILSMIEEEPMYYVDIDRRLSTYDFPTVATAFGKLHSENKLWKDPFGRVCIRGSQFDAKP
ncbi:UbiD family decarboxylase [Faunimonas sp. B44]|uniref:UbiD family decarboxylase n=1 Tax=Faunimonas sp. B44 TaxID=3461493 RepID=UPI004043E5BB